MILRFIEATDGVVSISSRSDTRKRLVWRSVPDSKYDLTFPCRAHNDRVRGSILRYSAASAVVSHFFVADVCTGGASWLSVCGAAFLRSPPTAPVAFTISTCE